MNKEKFIVTDEYIEENIVGTRSVKLYDKECGMCSAALSIEDVKQGFCKECGCPIPPPIRRRDETNYLFVAILYVLLFIALLNGGYLLMMLIKKIF